MTMTFPSILFLIISTPACNNGRSVTGHWPGNACYRYDYNQAVIVAIGAHGSETAGFGSKTLLIETPPEAVCWLSQNAPFLRRHCAHPAMSRSTKHCVTECIQRPPASGDTFTMFAFEAFT